MASTRRRKTQALPSSSYGGGTLRVTPQEADLLELAKDIMRGDSAQQPRLLHTNLDKLGPSAMQVLKSILSKGSVKALMRFGCGERWGSLRGPYTFERFGPLQLSFSPYTIQLLFWLGGNRSTFKSRPSTTGDELFAYLVLKLFKDSPAERTVFSQPGIRTPLTWLGFPREFARTEGGPPPSASEYDRRLANADFRTVLLCLRLDLARKWASTTLSSKQTTFPEVVAENSVLNSLTKAALQKGRYEAVTFILGAGKAVFRGGASEQSVAERLISNAPAGLSLRERQTGRRAIGSVLRALGPIDNVRNQLGLVRFTDPDYDFAQEVLGTWESLMPAIDFRRADRVVHILDNIETL